MAQSRTCVARPAGTPKKAQRNASLLTLNSRRFPAGQTLGGNFTLQTRVASRERERKIRNGERESSKCAAAAAGREMIFNFGRKKSAPARSNKGKTWFSRWCIVGCVCVLRHCSLSAPYSEGQRAEVLAPSYCGFCRRFE
jgi:hypothetical protein